MNFDFELILFYAVVITGLISLFDYIFLAKKRKQKYAESNKNVANPPPMKAFWIFEYAKSFFPIFLLVFFLRSFLYEMYRIPTGSLKPSMLVGDFPLINKFDYGVRLPVIHKKIIAVGNPKRGDIMVFHAPSDPSVYFIKRVIGLPGDHISYVNKVLTINGEKIPQTFEKTTEDTDESGMQYNVVQNQENLLGVKHSIYITPGRASEDFTDIVVPKNMYFAMGDNRDGSADSRYWGFVPDENVVGKAVLVVMSWNGEKYLPRFNRFFSKVD